MNKWTYLLFLCAKTIQVMDPSETMQNLGAYHPLYYRFQASVTQPKFFKTILCLITLF